LLSGDLGSALTDDSIEVPPAAQPTQTRVEICYSSIATSLLEASGADDLYIGVTL